MASSRLEPRFVERIWGRPLARSWGVTDDNRTIGEIWFEHPSGPAADLLVKYLFTSQALSVQVHPDDRAARAAGHPRGKDEAWFVLRAEPGAVIGLGLNNTVSSSALRAAALDGTIEKLIHWRPVQAGDVLFSPAGTVHAIGAGIDLIEIQQNIDLTYRLYDYKRGRDLHLDEGVAVASPGPLQHAFRAFDQSPERRVLVEGPSFVLERVRLTKHRQASVGGDGLLLIPIGGGGKIDGDDLAPRGVWRIDGTATIEAVDGIDMLITYPGARTRAGMLTLA